MGVNSEKNAALGHVSPFLKIGVGGWVGRLIRNLDNLTCKEKKITITRQSAKSQYKTSLFYMIDQNPHG